MHEQLTPVLRDHTQREPLQEPGILDGIQLSHGAGTASRTVAECQPVSDTERGRRSIPNSGSGVLRDEPVTRRKITSSYFAARLQRLARANEPAVFTSRVYLLAYTIAGKPDLHQWLNAERAERRLNPIRAFSENTVCPARKFTDGFDAFPSQHPRFPCKAVEEPS